MNNSRKLAILQSLQQLPRNIQSKIINNSKITKHQTISAGHMYSIFLKADGSVVGWGNNQYGQSTNQAGPFIAISAGDEHSLGLKADGSVVGWGKNEYRQITNQRGPFVAISAGLHHSLGLKADGSVVG